MSNSSIQNHEIPTDPLEALGVSLFLNITSYLPFPSLLAVEQVSRQWRQTSKDRERSIWRAACHRTGVAKKHMSILEMTERAMAKPMWYGEPGEEEQLAPGEASGSVEWKGICRSHVQLDRNWRFGRCRERYLTPPGNSVWRIKVDSESQTLLATDRTGGITVTDCSTSKALFEITGVRPFAHLEFAKGFVIFDTGRDFSLEIWRTQNAVNRSASKGLNTESDLCKTIHSHTHCTFNKTTQPLPKGHLGFYRKINPPTSCIAFRARVDHEDVEGKERALLATAGEQAVYIWDLEEAAIVETIRTDLTGDRIQYIEFDEEYVFICSHTRMHVFSRVTQKKVMTFPPFTESPWSLSLKFDLLNDVKSLPRQPVGVSGNPDDPEYHENWMAAQEGVEDYPGVQEGSNGITTLPGALKRPRDFSACHFTTNDLYCTARSGHVIVVRDYKIAFAAPADKRDEVVASHTILLDITSPAELLTTSRDRVVISTSNRVIILDPSTLPSLPFAHPIKPIRFNIIQSTCYDGVRMAACVQVDKSNIYHTYWALGEVSLGGIKDPISGKRRLPPLRALNEFGMCVKVWNFDPWV